MANFLSAVITRRQQDTEHLRRFWLRPSDSFTYKPGQYCTIGIDGVERPYSMASSPADPEIELFVERVEDGELTPRLYRKNEGDVVTLRPTAKGRFLFDESYQNHVMVATVTGIAPFVSMLRSRPNLNDGSHRFWVLHGASFACDLVYGDEIREMQERAGGMLQYMPTCSRPADPSNDGWSGLTGRVNLLVEAVLERDHLKPENTLVYACGNPGMVDDVKARLTPLNYKVKEERYWVD
jgi:ferredoxin-NADP reductase